MTASDVPDALIGSQTAAMNLLAVTAGAYDPGPTQDLAFTVPNPDNPSLSGIAVIQGQPSGWGQLVIDDGNIAARIGAQTDYGAALASADVNGDGFDDLLVGHPLAATQQGRVFLYTGRQSVEDWESDIVANTVPYYQSSFSGGRLGFAVASRFDMTSNGLADVYACAPGATDPDNGATVGVLLAWEGGQIGNGYGGNPGVDEAFLVVWGEGGLCSALAQSGDLDGNGSPEVIIGDPQANIGAGRVYVIDGWKSTPAAGEPIAAVTSYIIDGGAPGSEFGAAVAAVEGVWIDGYDTTIAIGAPGIMNDRGGVFLVAPQAMPVQFDGDDAHYRIWGFEDGMRVGAQLTATRQVGGGDGQLWIGAPGLSVWKYQAGGVAMVWDGVLEELGGEMMIDEIPGVVWGDVDGARLGKVMGRGDVDGDGRMDALLGAPGANHGALFVLRAAMAEDQDGDGYTADLEDCDDGNDEVHPFAAEVCDGIPDNDCDWIDDADEIDDDGDGQSECDGDCNDFSPDEFQQAAESDCFDGLDNDCDGLIDDEDEDCGDGDDDTGGDDDGGDDDGGLDDDDSGPAGFQCECRAAPAAWDPTVLAPGLLLLALLRRRG